MDTVLHMKYANLWVSLGLITSHTQSMLVIGYWKQTSERTKCLIFKAQASKAFQPSQVSLRAKVSGSFLWLESLGSKRQKIQWRLWYSKWSNCILTIKRIKCGSNTYIAKVLCSPWDSSNQLWKDKWSTVNWLCYLNGACNTHPMPLKFFPDI